MAEIKAKSPAELKAVTDKFQKEADLQTARLKESESENELLLSQLMVVQEELEKIFLDKKQLETTSAKAQEDAAALALQHSKAIKQLDAEAAKLKVAHEQTQKAHALEAAKQKTELAAAHAELAKVEKGLAQAHQNISKEQSAKQAAEAALAETKAKLPAEIKAVTYKFQQQADQHAAQFKDTTQENELLLTQLMSVQEELESYYLEKTKFEKLYQDIQTRWVRFEKHYPNYVDFGSVELVAFDNLSDVPSITWRVKDYAQSGVLIDEFLFQTVLQDGQPGIALVTDVNAPASSDSALVPKLLKPQNTQLERFVRLGQTEFRQIKAASSILTQLEASGWRAVELPTNFDMGFWRESLKLLPTQLQALPALLRYDAVKLKRELINPDYEHLWLEFKNMGLGARVWPKFEMRLGAALVQRGGFSQFPKFEIPLIDGKVKPFDSWYAESQDDNGAKLELRFALEQKVFDTSVWAKLDTEDKALLMRLIYAMPDVLLRLEAEHTVIERPWATWVGFAKAALQLIEANRAASQKPQQPKQLAAPDEAGESPALTPPAPAATSVKSFSANKTAKTSNKANLFALTLQAAPKKPAAKKAAPTTAATSKAATAKKTAAGRSAGANKPAAPAKKTTSTK